MQKRRPFRDGRQGKTYSGAQRKGYQRKGYPSSAGKPGRYVGRRPGQAFNTRFDGRPEEKKQDSFSGFQKARRERGTILPHALQGVFYDGKSFFTKNLVPGQKVYGERLVAVGRDEFREWDVMKSKLAASLAKQISQIGIKPGHVVLYLGAASGTTPSHVSDIVGNGGFMFALDFAPRVVRDLVLLSEQRRNIIPLLADARHPETYYHLVSCADVVYQDIAQREQADIFLKNCRLFLKSGGFGLLCIKARSVDVTRRPKEVFRDVRAAIEKELTIVDYRELDPFEKDHAMFVCKKK